MASGRGTSPPAPRSTFSRRPDADWSERLRGADFKIFPSGSKDSPSFFQGISKLFQAFLRPYRLISITCDEKAWFCRDEAVAGRARYAAARGAGRKRHMAMMSPDAPLVQKILLKNRKRPREAYSSFAAVSSSGGITALLSPRRSHTPIFSPSATNS